MSIEIKKIIKELLLSSTAYGVPNFLKSERLFNKLFWIFFLLTSSITSCFYVHLSIRAYLENDVVTIIKTGYDQPAEFPTITFCSRIIGRLNDLKGFKLVDMRFGYVKINDPFDHLETFFTSNGRCFRFNSGKNLSNHSIKIKKSIIGGRDDCFSLKINSDIGLNIWIHNKTSMPRIELYNTHDNYIAISNGTRSHIAIHKTVDSKLGLPYNQCFKDLKSFEENATLIKRLEALNQSYSIKNCLELCFELNYIVKNPCNCVNTSLGNVWFDCFIQKESSDQNGCTYKYKAYFYEKILNEECHQYCPLECDSVSYLVTSNDYINYDNFTSFVVYYQGLQYTLITQQPKMELFDIISSVGGILGLFIGISFVNLFEISEILIEIALIFINRFKSAKTIESRLTIKMTDIEN